MRQLLALLLFMFSCNVSADRRDWTPEEQNMFIASSIAITADWATTRHIAAQGWPQGTHETNIFLGRKPTPSQVDLYCIVLLVSNYYIADYMIPDDYRFVYLTARTVMHGAAAVNNYNIGVRIKF